MKKIYLVLTTLLIIVSCSSDDSSNNTESTNLPKLTKTIQSFTNGDQLSTEYSYDGDKLTEVASSDGKVIKYTYSPQKMVKDEIFENGMLIQTREFDIHNLINRVSKCELTNHINGEVRKYEYSKNSSGNIDIVVRVNNGVIESGSLTLNGNNLAAYTSDGITILYNFIYDNKINPLRQVQDSFFLTILNFDGGYNNITAKTGSSQTNCYMTYQYNAYDLPEKCTEKDSEGNIISTIEYIYE